MIASPSTSERPAPTAPGPDGDAPAPDRRSRLLHGAGIAVSVVCVVAVVVWALRQPAPEWPSSTRELTALGIAVLLYVVATLLRGERWKVLLEDQGATPSRADAHGIMVVGYMGNNVLPARGGDVFRVVLGASRARTGRRTVIGTLLAERLLDVVVLAVLFVVLATTIAGGAGLPEGRGLTALVLGGAGAVAVAALTAVVLHRRGALDRVRAFLVPIFASTVALRGRHGALMLAATLLIWGVEAAVWGTVGASVGVDMNPLEAGYVVALASMFAMIPSGPGYAGTQDAAAVIGITAVGGTAAQAVSYMIMVRFVLFVPVCAAGLVLVATRYGGLQRLRRA